MKLTYFKGNVPNFGDELNTYMWPRLLPQGFLDEDASELFLGIGSILWEDYPKEARKYVLGSGYGGYAPAPDVHDGTWDVIFVRGPRTAARLDLPPSKGICDSAILLRKLDLPPAGEDLGVAFMPHFHSFARGHWPEACAEAGIRLIDPRDDVEEIIGKIRGARMLITEAMHGAIVADALRTPWLAVRPIHAANAAKWSDWADSLELDLSPHPLQPSSLLEAYVSATKGQRYYGGRARQIGQSALAKPANKALILLAARHLRKLSRREPQLSRDDRINEACERANQAVEEFLRSRASVMEHRP
ncbi:polysaccharide pyruvyl transferase family protein [Chelativorans alearense]|uniref:polysaccharide pyruvyl transferase family protein n=1 Tax=Chelativorans alearense TaxID=2681495 RepID=UPI0013D3E9AB|nr:polysaccharide pyruvyl transferase family protein [Chelativorans alearense]